MNGRELLIRIIAVLGVAALFLVLLGSAHAVPIKPDIKKMVQQPPPRTGDYAPARAGWDGPENARPMAPAALAAKETVAQESAGLRHSLAGVLFPDPRILAAIAIAILGLRLREQKKRVRAEVIAIDARSREPMAA